MKKLGTALKNSYPFTLSGSIILYFSLFFLGYGFSALNFTAVSLSFFFLFIIAAVFVWVFFCAKSCKVERIIWNSSGTVDSSGSETNRQVVTVSCSGFLDKGSGKKRLFFIRYALIIKGSGKTAGGVTAFFSKRYRSNNEGVLKFSFIFPYPAIVSGNTYLFLEDIFGFVKIKLLTEKFKELAVIPCVSDNAVTDSRALVKDVITKQRKYDNDIEKYLMREYVPGDLARDINWKSSTRIDKLFTRISPGGRDETNILTFIYIPMETYTSDSHNAKNAFERFVYGKYFKEYFYTFLYRLKQEDKDKCEVRVFLDNEKCVIKELSDIYKAGELLALSAAKENRDVSSVMEALAEIPEGSSVTIFAENQKMLEAALEKLSYSNVLLCYIPVIFYENKNSVDSKNKFADKKIECKKRSFVFSSFFKPIIFYFGLIGAVVNSFGKISKKNKNSSFINRFAKYKIEQVKINMKAVQFFYKKNFNAYTDDMFSASSAPTAGRQTNSASKAQRVI